MSELKEKKVFEHAQKLVHEMQMREEMQQQYIMAENTESYREFLKGMDEVVERRENLLYAALHNLFQKRKAWRRIQNSKEESLAGNL